MTLHPKATSVVAALAAATGLALLLTACGGGGGFADTATPTAAASNGNDKSLTSFASGISGLALTDENGLNSGSANGTLAAATTNATDGTSSIAVTLAAAKALLQLPDSAVAGDWTGYRTLLVDVQSNNNIDAADAKLVTKSGTGYAWCSVSPAQAVTANSKTTLSFRLDWAAMQCNATPTPTDIKQAYLQIGGGSGNVVYLDNVRLTKSVRVMALGDSITGSPGCWRKTLWNDLQTSNHTLVDMVGVRNNMGDCGGTWDADNAGFGGMRVTTIGSKIGLANAARTDTVFVNSGVTAVPGNLAVWLEQTRPDLVMMNLATNDVWNGVTPTNILAGYDTLIAQMRASNPKMHILVAQIPHFAPSGCTNCASDATAFDTALAAWATCATTAASPITLVDLNAGWDPATMTADGVHPNDTTGTATMAANWGTPVKAALDSIDTNGADAPSSCIVTPVSDIADATTSTDTFTITSFKTGLGSFSVLKNDGNAATAAQATVALDTNGHATEGSQSAKVTVIAPPSGGWIGAAFSTNGGLADWGAYHYLKFDVTTVTDALNATVAVQSASDWSKWCQSSPATDIAANSTGTITLDLNTCGTNADLTHVQRFQLVISNASGTYYIDNVRLSNVAPVVVTPPVAADTADATTAANTFTLTSFKTGLGSWTVLDNGGNDGSAYASAALDAAAANASEGTHSAAVTITSIPSGGSVGLAQTGGFSDWTGYRYLKLDIKTGAKPFNGTVSVASWNTGSNNTFCSPTAWTWVNPNSTQTLVLDLTSTAACANSSTAGTLTVLNNIGRVHVFSNELGGFNVDNIRLTTN